MNPNIQYLNSLLASNEIDREDYLGRLQYLYSINPTDFSEGDTDFIEKQLNQNDIKFKRNHKAAEQSLGSVLNQLVSGMVEGFTTLGWADEADTTTERLANKMGHLLGFAPDIIAGVMTAGASLPGTFAKLTGKTAVKQGTKKLSQKQITKQLREEAAETTLGNAARRLNFTMGDWSSRIAFKFGKEGAEKTFRPFAKELKDGTGYQIRSVPMRVADFMVEKGGKFLDDSKILSSGWLGKTVGQSERFRKLAHDSAHLGIALGTSAVWEGPRGIAEATAHGALAGLVFGTTGEFVAISKLLGNPATRKAGESRLREVLKNPEQEAVMNTIARGIVGSGFQGGMSTAQGAPLPDQVYEYALGFFFGANTRSVNELKYHKIIQENPMLDGNSSVGKYKQKIRETKEFEEAPKEVKDMFERHFDYLYLQQSQRYQRLLNKETIEREQVESAEELGIDINKATPEQLKEIDQRTNEKDSVKELPEIDKVRAAENLRKQQEKERLQERVLDSKETKELEANEKEIEKIDSEIQRLDETETGFDKIVLSEKQIKLRERKEQLEARNKEIIDPNYKQREALEENQKKLDELKDEDITEVSREVRDAEIEVEKIDKEIADFKKDNPNVTKELIKKSNAVSEAKKKGEITKEQMENHPDFLKNTNPETQSELNKKHHYLMGLEVKRSNLLDKLNIAKDPNHKAKQQISWLESQIKIFESTLNDTQKNFNEINQAIKDGVPYKAWKTKKEQKKIRKNWTKTILKQKSKIAKYKKLIKKEEAKFVKVKKRTTKKGIEDLEATIEQQTKDLIEADSKLAPRQVSRIIDNDIKALLLSEQLVAYEDFNTSRANNDINEAHRINQAMERVIKQINDYEIANPERFQTPTSPAQIKTLLLQAMKRSVTEQTGYDGFAEAVRTFYPDIKLGSTKTHGNPLRTSYIRYKNWIFKETKNENFAITQYGKLKRIGPRDLEVDRTGKKLTVVQSDNPINIRHGQGTRQVIRYAEQKGYKKGTYVEPLEMYTPKEILSMYRKTYGDKDYYVYGATKDKGFVVLHAVPKGLKGNLPEIVKLLIKNGVKPSYIKTEQQQLEVASNLIYKLMDNGKIESFESSKLSDIDIAIKELKNDINSGTILGDVLKDVKYDLLTEGSMVPLETADVIQLVANPSYIDGKAGGYLNMVAVNDYKILPKWARSEIESGTDGGIIVRADLFQRIVETMGFSPLTGFIKPSIVASPRDGKGEIRNKVGAFKPESKKLDELMHEKGIHIITYKSGLKHQGNLKINELVEKDDQWSFKDEIDIARIKPEEFAVSLDVTDFVAKQFEINNTKKALTVYKQLLDKNTLQDFSPEYFKEIENMRVQNVEGNKEVSEKVDANPEFVDFKTKDVSIDVIMRSMMDDPLSPRSKKMYEDIIKTLQDPDIVLDALYEMDPAELAALELTPEILKRTDYSLEALVENRQFVSNVLAKYIIARTNSFSIDNGFKAYSQPYSEAMHRKYNIKDNEFMLGAMHRKDPITIEGVDKPTTLENAFNTFKTMKPSDPMYNNYKEALTYLIMRIPNSGNGGVRSLLFRGFIEEGGLNFFASELNDLYLGGKDHDGDTVNGYQSISPTIKRAFAKKSVQFELQNGDPLGKLTDLKDRDIAERIFKVVYPKDNEKGKIYGYSRTKGFEVSTKGDKLGKQFSAFNAKLKDGRSIEEAYQEAKGSGKGQPAKDPNFDYYGTYKGLWQQWAKENPNKIRELKDYLDKNNITTLRDRFAKTDNRQDRALSEILNELYPKDKEKGKYTNEDFSQFLSSESRLKAGKAALDGKKATGIYVNASTEFQMLFDFVTQRGTIDLGRGYEITLNYETLQRFKGDKKALFDYLKQVSYTGINIAVDSSEFVRVGDKFNNVNRFFKEFFSVTKDGRPIKDVKYYKLAKSAPRLRSFRTFSKVLTGRPRMENVLGPDGKPEKTEDGKYFKKKEQVVTTLELFKWSKEFEQDWSLSNVDTASGNYFMHMAKALNRLSTSERLVQEVLFDPISMMSREGMVKYLKEVLPDHLANSPTFKYLINNSAVDYYKRPLTEDRLRFLFDNPKQLRRFRGIVTNFIGMDLLSNQGDKIIRLFEENGIDRSVILPELERVLMHTFMLKQDNLKGINPDRGFVPNSAQVAAYILESKQNIASSLEKNIPEGLRLNPSIINQINRFYDYALLSHPVLETTKVPGMKDKIARYNQLVKEIKEINDSDPQSKYNSGQLRKKEMEARQIEQEFTKDQFFFKSAALDPINVKMFYAHIDGIYKLTSTPEFVKEPTKIAKQVKTEEGKPIDIEQDLVDIAYKKELDKDNEAREQSVEYEKEVVRKITKIDLEAQINNPEITNFGRVQLIRLKNFLDKNPGYTSTIDVLYETWTAGIPYRSFELGKEFTDINAKELKLFMDYMEGLRQPGLLKRMLLSGLKKGEDGQYYIKGKTNWATNFFGVALGRDLAWIENAKKDKHLQSAQYVVKDRNGNIKLKTGSMPVGTLDLNTQMAFNFHQIINSKEQQIKEEIDRDYRLIKPEDAKQAKSFDILIRYMALSREYNNGKLWKGVKNADQMNNIAAKMKELEPTIQKLRDEGFVFMITDPTATKGQKKPVTVDEIIKMTNEKTTQLLTRTLEEVIKSNWENLESKLVKEGKKIGIYVTPKKDIVIYDKTNPENHHRYEWQQLERIFLDKWGLLSDITKVDVVKKGLNEKIISDPLAVIDQIFSLTDVNFLQYHKKLIKYLEHKHPNINFQKELTMEQYSLVKTDIETFKTNNPKPEEQGIGRFVEKDGRVSKYWMHTGHFDTQHRKEVNIEYAKKKIEAQLKEFDGEPGSKEDNKLKSYNTEYNLGRISKKRALDELKYELEERWVSYNTKGVSIRNQADENMIIDNLNLRPPTGGIFRSNSNTKERSKEINLPEYDLTIRGLENYLNSMYRNLLNSNVGLFSMNNIEHFMRKEPFGKDPVVTESWGNFMIEVLKNQMGYPGLRNYDIHGLRKWELDTLKAYIDNGMKRSGMKLQQAEIDFLERIEYHYGLSKYERSTINETIRRLREEEQSESYIGKTVDKMEYDFKLDKMKKLAQEKNLNKVSRFGNPYYLVTDEAFVKGAERLDKVFGGNMLSGAPKKGIQREMYIARMAQNISDLEGKFQMMSLLFHPKSLLTNIYGGMQNTLTDVGYQPFFEGFMNGDTWFQENVYGKTTTYKFYDAATGQTVTRTINNKKDFDMWKAHLGVFRNIFTAEIQKDHRFQQERFRDPFIEGAQRLNTLLSKEPITEKSTKEFNDLKNLTINEAAKEAGVYDAVNRISSIFMNKSEYMLRSRTWDSAYINARQMLGRLGEQLPFDHPILIEMANKTVAASQFIYHATARPNYANTALGRIMTRFHPYTWNSIARRIEVYKGASSIGWREGYKTKRAQRQLTHDLFTLGLANIFMASIFEYALSPPMNWMQDTAQLLFGDEHERERAFYSQYPHPALAPLNIVTPPISRFVLSPMTALINGDFERLWKYQFATYFPFGRFGKDVYRTMQSPAMFGEFMFGIPVHRLHDLRRDQIEAEKEDDFLEEFE